MVFHWNSKNKENINKNEHNLRDKIRNPKHDYSKFCNGTLQGIFCNFWLINLWDIYITWARPQQARGICLAWPDRNFCWFGLNLSLYRHFCPLLNNDQQIKPFNQVHFDFKSSHKSSQSLAKGSLTWLGLGQNFSGLAWLKPSQWVPKSALKCRIQF